MDNVKVFPSSEGNVWKYVYNFGDAIAEAVLYKYESFENRTVICCSVQSGCPVGCTFCGTGKKFIRNLTRIEIISQVFHIIDGLINDYGFNPKECGKLQIMFMSMGEPMLNMANVEEAIDALNATYPNAQLLISTVGINDKRNLYKLMDMSYLNPKIGLQFSIHQSDESKRDKLIPFKNKMSLREIRDYGIYWKANTERPVYLNYCVDGDNISEGEINRLKDLFPPSVFYFTFSVVCSADETMKDAGFRNHDVIYDVMGSFIEDGYNVRMFDPAGQDDIGGGCGQLWYVQDWLKNKNICQK
jgi:23S rRNA (adenine2503-C2)-methyltransferase